MQYPRAFDGDSGTKTKRPRLVGEIAQTQKGE
jgi:hypothetical protein